MKNKIIDYVTIKDYDVVRYISLGWQPHGSPVMEQYEGYCQIWQAMVKYEPGIPSTTGPQ